MAAIRTTDTADTGIAYADILTNLFPRLDEAFPEFGFQWRSGGYWQSTTPRKVDGTDGDSKGKVFVYENNIRGFKDYTRGFCSFWDYLQLRDGLGGSETYRHLARLAGVNLDKQLSAEEIEAIKAANRQARLWEDLNDFLISCLHDTGNPFAGLPRAVAVRNYLVHQRGYTLSVLRAPGEERSEFNRKMELGFAPPLTEIWQHLKACGHQPDDIVKLLPETQARTIGETHTLSLPLRDHTGRIRGIKFRNINFLKGRDENKYINVSGTVKEDTLLFLRSARRDGSRDLVIVEGELDALHAGAAGIRDVVALGGNSLNQNHIQQIIRFGFKKVTFLPDSDTAGYKGLRKALELIRSRPELKVYVGHFPEGIKDLDELIVKEGAGKARAVIHQAEKAEDFLMMDILDRYSEIEKQANILTQKDWDDMLDEMQALLATVADPVDKDQLLTAFITNPAIRELGITRESLEEAVRRLEFKAAQEKQNKELTETITRAKDLQTKGKVQDALSLLTEKAKAIKQTDQGALFNTLLVPPTESQLRTSFQNKPVPLITSYEIEDVQISIPSGAISIIVAPTSHGKTAIINNLALDVAYRYPDKKFHVFTYEEDRDAILLKTLNVFIGQKLSENNLSSITQYFTGDTTQYFTKGKADVFLRKKEEFFRDYIDTRRLNIHYVDYDADTLMDAIRFLAKDPSTGGILIDYIQLLNLPANKYKTYSRQEELKQICLNLKDTAVETGLPILMGAQYNREVTHHLKMHATKISEAGDIERIAALIIGMWNNAKLPFGCTKEETGEIEDTGRNQPGTIYATIHKYRGQKTDVWTNWDFDGNIGRIGEIMKNDNEKH